MDKEIKDIRVVFTIFTLISLLIFYKNYPAYWSFVFAAISILLLVFITFSPKTLKPVFKVWITFAKFLGKVNTTILLTVLFIVVFIPLGIFMRILGKDLIKKKKESTKTYWEEYELSGLVDKKRYERQF